MGQNPKAKRVFRVKNPNQTPPGGWFWKDAETGKIFSGDTFSVVEESVTGFLLSNSRDAGNVEEEIHQTTGKNLFSRKREDLIEVTAEVTRGLRQYLSGASAIALKWWHDSPIIGMIKGENDRDGVFVDQAEGDRRAAVCCGGESGGGRCDENVIPSGKGWLQAWSDEGMIDCVDGRKTNQHDELGVCRACSCELRAAVWWSPKIVMATMRISGYEKNLPDHCWKKNLNNQK